MESYEFCKASGMQLLTFETQHEYESFMNHINEAGNIDNYVVSSQYQVARILIYFGASNTVLGSKTGWIWYDSGKSINFELNWGPGQPNNAGDNQLCSSLIIDYNMNTGQINYFMNDYQCYGTSYRQSFICQVVYGKKRGFKPKY